jgi:hypothetical protein
MMKIETEQDPFDGFDHFKLRGTISFGDAGEKAMGTISTYGARKSEAVEKAVKKIDELIGFLQDSKDKLGAV